MVSSSPSAPGRGPRTEAGRQGLLSGAGVGVEDEGGDAGASTVGSPEGGEQL